MRRREFITLLGGAAAWPVAARAQQGERMRRIGVLMYWTADDAEGQARLAAFAQALEQLGWSDGGAVQIVAPSMGVELSPVDVRDAGEIERAVTAFARGSNGGMIVTSSGTAIVHRQTIIALAARHRLPAVYSDRGSVTAGGL